VLETNKIIPVGGKRQIDVNARVIAATNRIPEEAVREQKLREDLYYRLNTFPLYIPPLRERGEDIPLLAQYFLDHYNQENNQHKTIHSAAMDILRSWSWPGNVRELRNIVFRAFILADNQIKAQHILFGHTLEPRNTIDIQLGTPLVDAERKIIAATLDSVEQDKKRAAISLAINKKLLERLLHKKVTEN
jgi:transcriptional regulator with PAS, ATPase and Fis domain